MAADNNRPTMLRLLLVGGADAEEARRVEVVTSTGSKESRDETPLYIAAKHGHEACVRMLLDHGVELGGTFCEGEGYTASIRISSLCHCMQNLISTISDKHNSVFSNFCVIKAGCWLKVGFCENTYLKILFTQRQSLW